MAPVPSLVRYTWVPNFSCRYTNAECTPLVTPSVNSEITFGCAGSLSSQMTMPFLRSDAPSRVNTRYLPSGVVMMSLMMRVLATTESVIAIFAGSVMSSA